MTDETFGKRLQRIREAKGMSQPQLAKAAAVAVGSLRNWEQGRREPSVTVAAQLAEGLGVTLDELAGKAARPPATAEQPAAPAAEEKPKRGRPARKKADDEKG